MRLAVLASTLVAAIILILLARSMPAEGFFSGDPGVKLIAAYNAVEHPFRPFAIDLPAIEGTPTDYVERFFWLHGDHSHVLQSPVFPLVSAPLVAAFGLRGAYVLPALAFIALVKFLAPVFRAAAPAAPMWIFLLVVVAANPIFFYALEFWEHVPAVALVAAATALLAGSRRSGGRALSAGLLTSLAILFRPEAAWYALALALVAGWKEAPLFAVGIAVLLAPAAALNYAAFGTPLGPHAAANLAPLTDHWLAVRLHRFSLWFVPTSWIALAGLVVIAMAHVGRSTFVRLEYRQFVALVGAVLTAFAAASGMITRDCLWQAWPAGALVLASGQPFSRTRQNENGSRALLLLAAITFALVLLTSTHDGGAQWGPRFLLIATPALVVLTACAAAALWSDGMHLRVVRRAMIILVLAASVFVSRDAFRELRGSKRYYARLTAATAQLVPEHGYVVTNLWWFDQITAALYRRHTVLNVTDAAQARSALRDLQAHGIRNVVIVTSPAEDEPAESPDVILDALGGDNCYVPVGADQVPERRLTFTRVRCR